MQRLQRTIDSTRRAPTGRALLAALVCMTLGAPAALAQDGDSGNTGETSGVFLPPQGLQVCQVDYGEVGTVRVSWANPEAYQAVLVHVDGELVLVDIDGAWGRVEVEAEPGLHEFSVIGVIGDWTSEEASTEFDVLAASPIDDPVSELSCEYFPGAGGQVVIEWLPGTDEWELGEVRLGGRRDIVEFGPDDSPLTIDLAGARPETVEVAFADIACYFSAPRYLDCPQLTPRFRRGDCDANGSVNISDAIFTANHLFLDYPRWLCDDACDANDDGEVDLTDATYVLTYLFRGGAPPPAPGPETCGVDESDDYLGGLCLDVCVE